MFFFLCSLLLVTVAHSRYFQGNSISDLVIVSREEWHAKPPTLVEPMANPVPYVIIHHSYQPGACTTPDDCIKAMLGMQHYHQVDRGWNDVGYSFAVGGDNRAYMGRGWSAVGAHAPNYNSRSIGICLIGDWRDVLPPASQLQVVKELIQFGVDQGKIAKNYRLLGHRQVRDTECPGDALFNEIQKWPHWISNPESPAVFPEDVNSGASGIFVRRNI